MPQRDPGNNIQTSTISLYTSIQGYSDVHLGKSTFLNDIEKLEITSICVVIQEWKYLY